MNDIRNRHRHGNVGLLFISLNCGTMIVRHKFVIEKKVKFGTDHMDKEKHVWRNVYGQLRQRLSCLTTMTRVTEEYCASC